MKDKLKTYVLLREQLLEELEFHEQKANEIRLALKGSEIGAPVVRGRRRGRPAGKAMAGRKPRSKITTNAAILKALEGGKQKGVKAIVQAVEQLKGKVAKASVSLGLGKLKKEGKIANPARGQYALKKT